MARVNSLNTLKEIWYLDSCASCYFINNRKLFIDKLWLKYLDFTIAVGQTIWAKSVGTIAILLVNKLFIKLWKNYIC